MEKGGQSDTDAQGPSVSAPGQDGPGSETERFRAITDLRAEGVTGESGVPHSQRDHELRRQANSLDEFS
jgi:hypothetical protein